LGQALRQIGKPAEAVAQFEEVLKREPGNQPPQRRWRKLRPFVEFHAGRPNLRWAFGDGLLGFIMRTVIYPGSFDPLTNGHLDVLQRATKLFDRVIVAVAENESKAPVQLRERLELVRLAIKGISNVAAEGFEGCRGLRGQAGAGDYSRTARGFGF
jgi:cytidyltransferase-like protein